MPEPDKKPLFGHPLERRGGGKTSSVPVVGQRRALSEDQLPPALPKKLSKEAAVTQQRSKARRYEGGRTDWQNLTLANGVEIEGRYYQLTSEVELGSLGLFDLPPRVGDASRFYDLKGGDWVFIRKGSWKSANPRRSGLAEVFVLIEPWQQGQNPGIRTFDDHGFKRHYGYADHQGIIDRQVVPQAAS